MKIEIENRFVVTVRTSREGLGASGLQALEAEIANEQIDDLYKVPGVLQVYHETTSVVGE